MRASDLQGQLPSYRNSNSLDDSSDVGPSAVCVAAQLTSAGDTLGLEARTTYVDSSTSGCVWGEWLTFCVKVRMHELGNAMHVVVNQLWSSKGRRALCLVDVRQLSQLATGGHAGMTGYRP